MTSTREVGKDLSHKVFINRSIMFSQLLVLGPRAEEDSVEENETLELTG